ncbi:hypothetical protein SLA2020_321020 [Shorea laevis]
MNFLEVLDDGDNAISDLGFVEERSPDLLREAAPNRVECELEQAIAAGARIWAQRTDIHPQAQISLAEKLAWKVSLQITRSKAQMLQGRSQV